MPPKVPKLPKIAKPHKPPSITAKALQTLLARIGSTSSGTKSVLYSRFLRDLPVSRLRNCHATWDSQKTDGWNRKLRIVSIDMGIKNLAFCDALVSYPGFVEEKGAKEDGKGWDATMEVLRWEKIDLVARTRDLQRPLPIVTSKGKASMKESASEVEDEDVDPYSLSVLSETAYRFIKGTILSGVPDIILIEKQRWRSGGGSAVQQWTVRVNTLEGMLWAVLATLKGERAHMPKSYGEAHPHAMKAYEVFAVDPKRVRQYWLQQDDAQMAKVNASSTMPRKSKATKDRQGLEMIGKAAAAEVETKKKPARSKAEKKAKINILRSWLSAEPTSTAPTTGTTTPTITFKLGASAECIRQALCSPTKAVRRSKKAKESENGVQGETPDVRPEIELKKLDDVTDCFLQVAAWVSWESNRLQLQNVAQQQQTAENGSVPEVDDGVLLNMVREIGGEG